MHKKLAIYGGTPAVSKSHEFALWASVDKTDEAITSAALRQINHSGGEPHIRQLGADLSPIAHQGGNG